MFDLLTIILIILLTLFGYFIYNEYRKHERNTKLSHSDKNGRYWKYLTEGKNGSLFFVDTHSGERVFINEHGIDLLRITVTLKKIYSNEELNSIIVSQDKDNKKSMKNSPVSYDILTFHFIKDNLNVINGNDSKFVCFAGGISYDFNNNPCHELKGIKEWTSFKDFVEIRPNSEMELIFNAISFCIARSEIVFI